jgi:broad specificity phosphatase PhoE
VNRLLLVRHAPTSATRAAAFPRRDDPISDVALNTSTLPELPAGARVLSSTMRRARATAELFTGEYTIDPLLDECDFGTWAGSTFAELHEQEPDVLAQWLKHPDAAPHGGESLTRFASRVSDFLSRAALLEGPTVAFTHGGFIKVAVALALDAPLTSMWRVDVAPLSITELERFDEGWTLRRANWRTRSSLDIAFSDVPYSRRSGM